MQEVMQQMSRKITPGAKQGVEITLKREVQEETQENSHPEEEIHQEKGENYPVENASIINTQIFLGVQTLRNTYQENQMDQIAYPRKYADCA